MGIIQVDLALDLLLDEGGNRKIGLADVAPDHIPSLLLKEADQRSDLECIFAVDPPRPV